MSVMQNSDVEKQALEHGILQIELERQLKLFQNGIPNLVLEKPALVQDGILQCDKEQIQRSAELYRKALQHSELKVMKFVPASGAASRMFKDLESLLNKNPAINDSTLDEDNNQAEFGKVFIRNIRSFAFWNSLKDALSRNDHDAEELLKKGEYQPLIEYILTDKGLNYSAMPKALIYFHKNSDTGEIRTSLEEHFIEGLLYAKNGQNQVNLHFTVSPEFADAINDTINQIKQKYESNGVRFETALSYQQPSTDTVAVDENNKPFEDENGRILFRPGGHGALIDNLNKLNADIVFIKNIDNVVPDTLKEDTVNWKQALGGILLDLRNRVFEMRKQIQKQVAPATIMAFATLCRNELNLSLPANFESESAKKQCRILLEITDRPMRVCGMVKNEGEPGGGPFWVKKDSYVNRLQIVESSQIDQSNEEQFSILKQSTHFNPVDIVCSLTNDKGESFDLNAYVDEETAFIANKSYDGRGLKALERPGLWNGGMAGWITIFAEVPVSTFNPVKTVNDLLRKSHQG